MRNRFILGAWMTTTALLCGIASCALAYPHPGKHELHAEKHGRIVDADAGTGIPDAKIIAVWRQNSSGVSDMVSGGSWCNLQKIVTTDADGRYVIPDVAHELDASEKRFGPLSLNKLRSEWLLIVFKPGYARIGDMERLPTHEKQRFVWEVEPPETYELPVGKADIQPIAVKKVDMSPRDVWIYYSAILSASECNDSHGRPLDEPEFGNITKAVSEVVRPLPCSMPQETSIGLQMLNAYTALVHDPRFDHRIVQAVGQREWGTKGTTAGALCHALIDEEKAP